MSQFSGTDKSKHTNVWQENHWHLNKSLSEPSAFSPHPVLLFCHFKPKTCHFNLISRQLDFHKALTSQAWGQTSLHSLEIERSLRTAWATRLHASVQNSTHSLCVIYEKCTAWVWSEDQSLLAWLEYDLLDRLHISEKNTLQSMASLKRYQGY